MLKKRVYMFLVVFLFSLVHIPVYAELVSEWRFDGNAKDSKGNNHGRLKGNPTWTSDRYGNPGKALNLDGIDDYVNCGNDESLNLTSAITLEAWVKTTSSAWQGIAVKWPGGKSYALSTDYIANGQVMFLLSYNGTDYYVITGTTDLANTGWHHIAGTYDGAWMRLYVDGMEESSREESFTIHAGTGELTIGSWSPSVHPFNGTIDEVKIYNRALSAEEIKNNCKK